MTEENSNEVLAIDYTHVLLIDLDYVGVNLRNVEFEAMQKGLNPKGVELNKATFTKSSMSPNYRFTIKEILTSLGKKADAIEKAVSEVKKSVNEFFENTNELNNGIINLIDSAKKGTLM